jgi:hypothetical protein
VVTRCAVLTTAAEQKHAAIDIAIWHAHLDHESWFEVVLLGVKSRDVQRLGNHLGQTVAKTGRLPRPFGVSFKIFIKAKLPRRSECCGCWIRNV